MSSLRCKYRQEAVLKESEGCEVGPVGRKVSFAPGCFFHMLIMMSSGRKMSVTFVTDQN